MHSVTANEYSIQIDELTSDQQFMTFSVQPVQLTSVDVTDKSGDAEICPVLKTVVKSTSELYLSESKD